MEYCKNCIENHKVQYLPVESAHIPAPVSEKCNCKCHN